MPIAGPGAVVVWELTNFGAECSSKDCGSLPAPSSSIFITGIVVDGLAGDSPAERLPTIQQQTITYPVQLEEDGPISFITMTGQLDQPSADPAATGSYVLTGTPPGLSATGSLTVDVDVSEFPGTPFVSFTGAMVICGL